MYVHTKEALFARSIVLYYTQTTFIYRSISYYSILMLSHFSFFLATVIRHNMEGTDLSHCSRRCGTGRHSSSRINGDYISRETSVVCEPTSIHCFFCNHVLVCFHDSSKCTHLFIHTSINPSIHSSIHHLPIQLFTLIHPSIHHLPIQLSTLIHSSIHHLPIQSSMPIHPSIHHLPIQLSTLIHPSIHHLHCTHPVVHTYSSIHTSSTLYPSSCPHLFIHPYIIYPSSLPCPFIHPYIIYPSSCPHLFIHPYIIYTVPIQLSTLIHLSIHPSSCPCPFIHPYIIYPSSCPQLIIHHLPIQLSTPIHSSIHHLPIQLSTINHTSFTHPVVHN